MARAQKRFPWWLLGCWVFLVVLAAALGLVGVAAWQGTIVTRYALLEKGMSGDRVRSILGAPQKEFTQLEFEEENDGYYGGVDDPPPRPPTARSADLVWEEGPVRIVVHFEKFALPDGDCDLGVTQNVLRVKNKRGFTWWRVRRRAEEMWTAIHGPRR